MLVLRLLCETVVRVLISKKMIYLCHFCYFFVDSPPGSLHKKHKKHKKKHKKRKDGDLDELSPKPPITLKLKIGGETLGTKRYLIAKRFKNIKTYNILFRI